MVQLGLALVLWIIPALASSATYYVAPTGNNANNGSEAAPWATVKKAVDTMVAGDTTYLRGGTFVETAEVRFARSGTASAPITLKAYPNETPIISFSDPSNGTHRVVIWNSSGANVAIGWIVIEGITFEDCAVGVRFYSAHDVTVRNNAFRNNRYHGMLGNGTRILIDRNIFNHNGGFDTCSPIPSGCIREHGLYMNGSDITITNNLFYDNLAYGIVLNGSSSAVFNSAVHPSAEYANSYRWIIANNTFAYNRYRGGITVWGHLCNDARIENNIFYENSVSVSSAPQGIECTGCSLSTGIKIRNNHFYASGSGGTVAIESDFNADLVSTGNITNVSAPAFVNGGSNSLPASPDFRLTARAPVNIALAAEFPNNGVVGAFQPPASPTVASITTNKITVNLPMSAAVPVQNLSTAGVSFSCTSNVCPGSPTVSSVSRAAGTDSQPEITLSGITSNACLSHADPVTVSYNASTGSWTGNDNIGPYPGLHQKILSFTSVAVVNNCTGSGPPGGTPSHISYPMENGSGTTVSDTSGNAIHATTSGTWVSGKTGFGIKVAGGTTQQTTIPYGSEIDPTSQSMTWVVPVFVATGTTAASNFIFGTEVGTDQRGYIAATLGTWRVGRKNINTSSAGASNLAVTEGWNHLCVRWDATTDTVTLYKDGVAGTGGATGSYTSYTLATNFEAPILGTGFPTTVTETIYDDVQIFTSLQDCATLYAAWNAPPPAPTGTLTQEAIQFQGVILDASAAPIVVGSSQTIEVPAGGAAVILFQIHCENIDDCDETAFKLVYANSIVPTTYQQVPNLETADGTWMWGVTPDITMNAGLRSTRLTGSCTLTTGTTQALADQVPSVDLPQDGCVVLAYIVRVGSSKAGTTFEYRLLTESGLALAGGYDQIARIKVVNPMSSGIGF